MMTIVGSERRNRRSRRVAAVGSVLGLAYRLWLTARLVQWNLAEPGGRSLLFPITYGAILLAPFVASIAALETTGRAQVKFWAISGVIASVLATFSPGLVAGPLVVPAGFLLVAAATGGNE